MSDGGEGGGGGHVDSIWNVSGVNRWPMIPHYYGDAARQLLLGAAALMIIASPLYSNNLRAAFPFIMVGALVAVAFAALTNPRDVWVSIGNAIISGVGAVVYTTWGIYEYEAINPIAFMLRVAIGIIFLFAFYFSVKTVRAFMLRQIGKLDAVDDFESDAEKANARELEWESKTKRPYTER